MAVRDDGRPGHRVGLGYQATNIRSEDQAAIELDRRVIDLGGSCCPARSDSAGARMGGGEEELFQRGRFLRRPFRGFWRHSFWTWRFSAWSAAADLRIGSAGGSCPGCEIACSISAAPVRHCLYGHFSRRSGDPGYLPDRFRCAWAGAAQTVEFALPVGHCGAGADLCGVCGRGVPDRHRIESIRANGRRRRRWAFRTPIRCAT